MFQPLHITSPLHVLILAAGASARMRGRDKLLEEVGGAPLLRLSAMRALASGLPVAVTLPAGEGPRQAALDGLSLARIAVPDAGAGLSASLRAGLAALPAEVAVMILLADMPEIDESDLTEMARAFAKTPLALLRGASADGVPGHPVILPPWARAELSKLSGDDGARALLRSHARNVRLVPLPDRHATTDLDTPEDWAAWRKGRGKD